jgi:competence ComEA-like helix-hairpin-helix protein
MSIAIISAAASLIFSNLDTWCDKLVTALGLSTWQEALIRQLLALTLATFLATPLLLVIGTLWNWFRHTSAWQVPRKTLQRNKKPILLLLIIFIPLASLILFPRVSQSLRDQQFSLQQLAQYLRPLLISATFALTFWLTSRLTNSRIDINTADQHDLESLPGVGPTLALKIIQHRERYGYFHTITDLKDISGIGDKTLRHIGPDIKIKKTTKRPKTDDIQN